MDTGCWLYYNTLIKIQRYSQRVFRLRTDHSSLRFQDSRAAANSATARGVSTVFGSFTFCFFFFYCDKLPSMHPLSIPAYSYAVLWGSAGACSSSLDRPPVHHRATCRQTTTHTHTHTHTRTHSFQWTIRTHQST